jgi:hypothetical protein
MFKIFNLLDSKSYTRMRSHDGRPHVPTLQSSTQPSVSQVRKQSQNREREAARFRSDDDDSFSSDADSSRMSQSSERSGTSESKMSQQDSASQHPNFSKEWMFEGLIAFPSQCGVDWDGDGRVPDKIRQEFSEIGESLEQHFSRLAPAEIEYIMIFSNVLACSTKEHRNEKFLQAPLRGYVATKKLLDQKAWENSIPWCDTDQNPLVWTKVTGGIRSWPDFTEDRNDVNDPTSNVSVLAMWGTRSSFDARGKTWAFFGSLAVPSQTAADGDVLQIAREAFNAAAGLRDSWPSGIKFLTVHC